MLKAIKTATLISLTSLMLTSGFSLQATAQSSAQSSAQFNNEFRPQTQQRLQRHSVNSQYVNRSNNNDKVLGGVIGAVAGGVIGSQVAGNGARTEGSILGALLGGVAGAAIADSNSSSSRDFDQRRRYDNSRNFGGQYRGDVAYDRYNDSKYYTYDRRKNSRDSFISRDFNASGFPSQKGFGTNIGPHGSHKRTNLLGGRF